MTDDRLTKNPLGDVGRRVRDNIKALRAERGLTHQQLSEMLTKRGRPIPVLGLSRIENGARRVDVDDLAALAWVLGTTSARLLEVRAKLTVEEYKRHQAAITRAEKAIVEMAVAGVEPEAVFDYLKQSTNVEAIRSGVRPELDDGDR